MPHRPKAHQPAGLPKPTRPGANAKGYTYRWQQRRLLYLEAHPLCAECERAGLLTPATELDHVTPHRGDPVKFNDPANLQGLCKSCHSRKTARGE